MKAFDRHLLRLVRSNSEFQKQLRATSTYSRRVTSAYDVAEQCNLFCEGCLFFSADGSTASTTLRALTTFEHKQLFRAEKERGVTYPVFAGAEPSLVLDVLEAATQVWNTGMVHTNGVRKIPQEYPFRLYVSCWGHRENTKKWRGADCYDKVLDNIEGDLRAIVNYTISSANIGDIEPVVEDCIKRKIPITFQVYSGTDEYLSASDRYSKNASLPFLREKLGGDSLLLSEKDNQHACDVICRMIDQYPETIIFTKPLAHWLFTRKSVYGKRADNLNPSNFCRLARSQKHKHFLIDGTEESVKNCGHPNIDCENCRLYTIMYEAYFEDLRKKSNVSSDDIKAYFSAHGVFDFVFNGHEQNNCYVHKFA